MTDLIQRLAEGPGSRELSDEVLRALGAERRTDPIANFPGWFPHWLMPNGRKIHVSKAPDVSESVDDALALAKGAGTGCSLNVDFDLLGRAEVDLWPFGDMGQNPKSGAARGENGLARAICIAVLGTR